MKELCHILLFYGVKPSNIPNSSNSLLSQQWYVYGRLQSAAYFSAAVVHNCIDSIYNILNVLHSLASASFVLFVYTFGLVTVTDAHCCSPPKYFYSLQIDTFLWWVTLVRCQVSTRFGVFHLIWRHCVIDRVDLKAECLQKYKWFPWKYWNLSMTHHLWRVLIKLSTSRRKNTS